MKRRGLPIDGFLVLDKPVGIGSTPALGRARRALGAAKAGHAGTLDPLASGVLVIALGEATKLVSFVMDGAKRYRFGVRWGEARTTDDAEGEVTATSPARPGRAAIEAALARFTGEIAQVPPAYSAIKLAGRPAYARARAAARRSNSRRGRSGSTASRWSNFPAPTGRCSRSPAARGPTSVRSPGTWRKPLEHLAMSTSCAGCRSAPSGSRTRFRWIS